MGQHVVFEGPLTVSVAEYVAPEPDLPTAGCPRSCVASRILPPVPDPAGRQHIW
jgi:hypothetical protein